MKHFLSFLRSVGAQASKLGVRIMFSAFCILHFAFVSAQEQKPLFDSETYQTRFDYAKRLNARGRYMEAYDFLKKLHADILQTMENNGYEPARIPSHKDFKFYLNVVSSQAECAYMLNLWKEMEPLYAEHVTEYNRRFDYGLTEDENYNGQIAAFYKMRGDSYYIRGTEDFSNYSKAYRDYHDALDYYFKDDDSLRVMNYQEEAKVYADLAQVEYARGFYDDAINYMEKAAEMGNQRIAAGTNAKESFTRTSAMALNVEYNSALAMCYAQDFDFRKALSIIENIMSELPRNDKRLPELKRRKAKILMLQNEDPETSETIKPQNLKTASKLYETYFAAIKDTVNNNFMQMTADQREEYWMLQRPFVVDCYLLEEHNPELLYDVTLYNKGMLLQMARSFEDLLYDGTSVLPQTTKRPISQTTKLDERKKLNLLRQQDAQNALEGKLTTLAEDYEKELLRTMSVDGRRKKFFAPLNRTWKDIQKAMPTNGCAIEFVEYEKDDSMHFGALVLKKTGKPRFVHVCNANDLLEYEPSGWIYTMKELLGTTDGSYKNHIYEDEDLPDMIWNKDLVAAIGNCKKVYFSADGYLHLLAVEYLLPESLQDKSFYRLSSTRVLADGSKPNAKIIKEGKAFVLGGITYDSFRNMDKHSDPGNDAKAFNILQEKGAYFSYMEGAKVECDSIIHYRNNPDDLYLKSLQATEHAFYENCSNYPIIHISTHGSFGGDKDIYDELLASSSKDVLSESILALSNAGTHLRDKTFDAFNKDGLLSAREVARLNLQNVQLVTTSACQTGLGYITADGLYGMERGFKSAGAKGLVMTLWSVNIESARIFFTAMYRYMAQGESVYKAFHHARNDLLTKTFTTTTLKSKFKSGSLSRKDFTTLTANTYHKPQHSYPYILIDVWE